MAHPSTTRQKRRSAQDAIVNQTGNRSKRLVVSAQLGLPQGLPGSRAER